ncbi:hypothetical protein PS861_02161 [Pseudomonas fluorescens]|jgi:hypothetical protein|nr:hypothetical protein PS861_02161 [Pseudomonas fluorescens]
MKIKRPSLPPKPLKQSLFFSPEPKRPGPPVRTVQSQTPQRSDERSWPRRVGAHAPDGNALFTPSSPLSRYRHPYESLSLYGRMPLGWVRRARAETQSPAAVAIKVETGLMDLSLRNTDAGPCVPCYLSIMVVGSRSIPEWRLFYGVTLEQATLSALDSMFEKVPGSVSMYALVAQRYRYRGTDYEVAALRNDGVWLRPTRSPNGSAVFGGRSTPRRAQDHPNPETLLSRLRARARTEGARLRRDQRKAQWIDQQPEVIRELLCEVARVYGIGPERSPYNALAHLVLMQLARFNESRPLSDRIKKPGLTMLYRLLH